MDQEAKDELKSILATYQERLSDGRAREAKVKAARIAFVEAFQKVKTETIGPVLEEFAVQLNEAGHSASVVDQREASDRNGQFTPASVALRIAPARMGDMALVPSGGARIEVTFSAHDQTMKVVVSSSNNSNGSMGKRGEYELSELTSGFVEGHVLKTIREAFAIRK
jgi:hypothetical protein